MIFRRKRTIILVGTLIFLVLILILGKRFFSCSAQRKAGSATEAAVSDQKQGEIPSPNSLYFGFESDPKTGTREKLYEGIAHSGQFSGKAFGKESYSISIERTVEQIGPDNLKAISVSAWLYVKTGKEEPDAVFVFSATDEKGAGVSWKGITIKGKEIPRGKWFKMSGMFNLADVKLQPGNRIQFYLWNRSNTDFLVDDLYVVFGTQPERKGDSALVNMTAGKPFTPRFNYPPYRTAWLQKEETGNGNSPGLVSGDGKIEGEITPSDRIIVGRFVGNTDDILVRRSSGRTELFSFCSGKPAFRKINVEIPPEVQSEFTTGEILKGAFFGKGAEQLLVAGKKDLLTGSLEITGDPCSGKETKAKFRLLSRTSLAELSCPEGLNGVIVRTADLNGDQLAELLVIHKDGSWMMFSYAAGGSGKWSVAASGKNDIREWEGINTSGSVSAGKFSEKYPQDLVLSVFREGASSHYCYSLQRFDPSSRKFVQFFPAGQKFCGLTIGLDTLKPSDLFLAGKFSAGDGTVILRYNRDWRFDLKQIRFNETTFEVLRTVDFQGYEKDRNPKYYEDLTLIPGNFRVPGISSLLVNARLKKGRKLPCLPNSIGIYTLMVPGK